MGEGAEGAGSLEEGWGEEEVSIVYDVLWRGPSSFYQDYKSFLSIPPCPCQRGIELIVVNLTSTRCVRVMTNESLSSLICTRAELVLCNCIGATPPGGGCLG